MLVIVYIYVIKLKLGLLKPFYLASCILLTIYLISYYIGNSKFEVLKLLPIGLISSSRSMDSDITDREEDKLNKIYTFPVLIGKFKTKLLCIILMIISMFFLDNVGIIMYLCFFAYIIYLICKNN